MKHTFVSELYSHATHRNMSVASERVLCHFYMLRRKSKHRKPSQVSKYTFKCEVKLPSFVLDPF